MGMDDRDDSYRSRGPAPRRRSYDGDEMPSRSGARDMRDMSGPRSRPPRRDSGGDDGYDRRPRGSSSGRPDGYDRRPRPDDSRGPRRSSSYDGYDRPSRGDWGDPNGSSPRGSRSGRPPMRDDGWGETRGPRGGGRGPSVSDGRMRRVAPGGGRGGGWGNDGLNGGMSANNLRSRLMAGQEEEDDEEEGSPGAGIAKAIGAIVLALVLGIGAAYGYYVLSTPKLQATPYQPPANHGADRRSEGLTDLHRIHPAACGWAHTACRLMARPAPLRPALAHPLRRW